MVVSLNSGLERNKEEEEEVDLVEGRGSPAALRLPMWPIRHEHLRVDPASEACFRISDQTSARFSENANQTSAKFSENYPTIREGPPKIRVWGPGARAPVCVASFAEIFGPRLEESLHLRSDFVTTLSQVDLRLFTV